MSNINIYKPPETLEEAALILADHMPQGRAWGSKSIPGSGIHGLVKGLVTDFLEVLQKIYELSIEFDINQSVHLLDDWEESMGIPNECIYDLVTLQERRDNILGQFSQLPVVNVDDFETLGSQLTGLSVTVEPGLVYDHIFSLKFPVTFDHDGLRFVMYVTFGSEIETFPYTFPFTFISSERFDIVKCVFERVKPANVLIVYPQE